MATKFIHTWTGTNGAVWPDFTRVAGGAFDAIINSNQGAPGATGAERIYQSDFWPTIRDYKTQMDAVWLDAVGSGDGIGAVARLTDDGLKGYIAVLYSHRPSDSTLNMPHIIVYRRRAGTNTEIVAETDISGTISGTDLEAGVNLELRVENTSPGEVNLKVSVDKGGGYVEFVDFTDTTVPIESGGTAGVWIDGNSTGTDMLGDNLARKDIEDEASA